ncbi:MAG: hypothetical protein H0Z34_13320 [Brevibacillus sp.]|nr:hypothetical protein [Brevibacillus sp.]
MTRQQRLRTCGNLIQMIECAKSRKAAKIYRKQLETTLSRLKPKKKQPHMTTA